MTVPVVLQTGGMVTTIVGLALLIVVVAALASSTEIVDATEVRALVVFGEYRRTLQPGINFVPPFVALTYSIERRPQELALTVDDARSRDGEPVAVDVVVEAKVADPEAAFLAEGDPYGTIQGRARSAVHDAIRSRVLDDVRSYPGGVGEAVERGLRDAEDWGVEVRRVTVESVARVAEPRPAG